MNIQVNEELRAYIDPLTPDEHQALERSLLAEGCRDALVLWGEVLVDGHNRYGICQQHGIPFRTVQAAHFKSLDDVHLWMIDQTLGRRSVSDYQRGVLALRKKEIVAARREALLAASAQTPAAEASDMVPNVESEQAPAAVPPPEPLNTREAVAKAARISSAQVVMIEKIQKQAAPELVAALKTGELSLNAAAAVASLPAEAQAEAVAGGKDELRRVAKQVREAKRKPRAEEATEQAEGPAEEADVASLQARVQALTAENEALKAEVARLKAQLSATDSVY
ncbi:MAG: plasmid replication/partition related protein [Burkholderiaceae bacterium]|nr:plasmid replication/partition related protein [Burkholderiaceae bacterium]